MQYMGGKAKIARRVVGAVLADTTLRDRWFEPFVGGGNVMEHACPHFTSCTGSDLHPDLVMMWQEVSRGWTPPDMTRDRYKQLRSMPSSPERGYAGFGASFGGKWFGGYGVSPRDGEVWRASQRALVRQGSVFRAHDVRFLLGSYDGFTPPPGTVVYCDPPYAGTTGYSTGGFDHREFYRTLLAWSVTCPVYVSEYTVPEDVPATVIWQREKRNVLEKGDNRRTSVERLFRIGPPGRRAMGAERFTSLDIETGSADDVYRLPAGSRDYIKLVGVGGETYDGPALFGRTPYATVNGNFFDFPVLDRHAGIPVEKTIPFSRDLRLAAFQHDPPTSYQTKRGPGYKRYSMEALAERYLGDVRKSDQGKELAKEYGGWGNIPADDPRFHEYLRADLEVTRRLNEAIPWDPYEEREAWVSTVTARTTLNGFRVDVEGLEKRVRELGDRLDAGRALLATYGFPLTNKAGGEAKAPQRTAAGKEAFTVALRDLGFPVDRWPRGKDGTLSLSKEVMAFALETARDHFTEAHKVIEAVSDMNGVRNSAQNLLDNTHHGRVHYSFEPFQATGRWSCGLTVLKKGCEDSEREFLTPEEGHVLVSVDLDQVDIRSVAAHSQDPALIALLNDPARDIHTEIAELSGVPRKAAKTLDLGWLYGRSANAMAQMPGMTRDAADRVCRYMTSAFPKVVEYQARTRALGEAGVLLDNGFGRRLRVDQERAYTQSVAMVGQSTTREFIAEGMLDLARRAPEMLPMLRVLVHDECVFSVPESDKEECARIAQECLSRKWAPPGGSVPVSITAGQGKPFTFGRTWGELYM